MDYIIKSFLCVMVMHMSVLIYHNTRGWISLKFSYLFRRMFAILRKAVTQSNKSNFKTSSNIECVFTNNSIYRFKSINILLHVGPWLHSYFVCLCQCFKVMLILLCAYEFECDFSRSSHHRRSFLPNSLHSSYLSNTLQTFIHIITSTVLVGRAVSTD